MIVRIKTIEEMKKLPYCKFKKERFFTSLNFGFGENSWISPDMDYLCGKVIFIKINKNNKMSNFKYKGFSFSESMYDIIQTKLDKI